MRMNKIYTKKGDKGKTKTFLGEMSKGDRLAEALGTIDELNSWIGLCRYTNSKVQIHKSKTQVKSEKLLDAELKRVQGNLMTIASHMAGSEVRIGKGEVSHLERMIDKLDRDLPKLKNFIYPVGELQVARSVARRCERQVVRYSLVDKNILKYLNRLSDALFVMARWVNYRRGVAEEVWNI